MDENIVRNILSIALLIDLSFVDTNSFIRLSCRVSRSYLRKYLHKDRFYSRILSSLDSRHPSTYRNRAKREKQAGNNERKVLKVRLPRAISHSREHYLDGNCGSSIHRGQQISAKRAETTHGGNLLTANHNDRRAPPLVQRTRSRGTRSRFTANDTGEVPNFFFFLSFLSPRRILLGAREIKFVTNILLYRFA